MFENGGKIWLPNLSENLMLCTIFSCTGLERVILIALQHVSILSVPWPFSGILQRLLCLVAWAIVSPSLTHILQEPSFSYDERPLFMRLVLSCVCSISALLGIYLSIPMLSSTFRVKASTLNWNGDPYYKSIELFFLASSMLFWFTFAAFLSFALLRYRQIYVKLWAVFLVAKVSIYDPHENWELSTRI